MSRKNEMNFQIGYIFRNSARIEICQFGIMLFLFFLFFFFVFNKKKTFQSIQQMLQRVHGIRLEYPTIRLGNLVKAVDCFSSELQIRNLLRDIICNTIFIAKLDQLFGRIAGKIPLTWHGASSIFWIKIKNKIKKEKKRNQREGEGNESPLESRDRNSQGSEHGGGRDSPLYS